MWAGLERFYTIVSTFYVCPAALMLVHDLLFPIAQRLEGASDRDMVDSIALLAPMFKSPSGNGKVRYAVIPDREGFFPLSHATKQRGESRSAAIPTVSYFLRLATRLAGSTNDDWLSDSPSPVMIGCFGPFCELPVHFQSHNRERQNGPRCESHSENTR